MLIIKLIALCLAIITISKGYVDYRQRLESKVMFLFWVVVWILATAIVIYPPLIDKAIIYTKDQTITIGSLTGLGFIFMLYIVYRIYTKAARIERQLSNLIHKLALNPDKTEE